METRAEYIKLASISHFDSNYQVPALNNDVCYSNSSTPIVDELFPNLSMADTKPAIPEVKHNGKTIRLKYQTQVTKLALKTEAELEYLDALREYTAVLLIN